MRPQRRPLREHGGCGSRREIDGVESCSRMSSTFCRRSCRWSRASNCSSECGSVRGGARQRAASRPRRSAPRPHTRGSAAPPHLLNLRRGTCRILLAVVVIDGHVEACPWRAPGMRLPQCRAFYPGPAQSFPALAVLARQQVAVFKHRRLRPPTPLAAASPNRAKPWWIAASINFQQRIKPGLVWPRDEKRTRGPEVDPGDRHILQQ